MVLSIPASQERAEEAGDRKTRGEAGMSDPRGEGEEGSKAASFLFPSLIWDLGEVVMRQIIGATAF